MAQYTKETIKFNNIINPSWTVGTDGPFSPYRDSERSGFSAANYLEMNRSSIPSGNEGLYFTTNAIDIHWGGAVLPTFNGGLRTITTTSDLMNAIQDASNAGVGGLKLSQGNYGSTSDGQPGDGASIITGLSVDSNGNVTVKKANANQLKAWLNVNSGTDTNSTIVVDIDFTRSYNSGYWKLNKILASNISENQIRDYEYNDHAVDNTFTTYDDGYNYNLWFTNLNTKLGCNIYLSSNIPNSILAKYNSNRIIKLTVELNPYDSRGQQVTAQGSTGNYTIDGVSRKVVFSTNPDDWGIHDMRYTTELGGNIKTIICEPDDTIETAGNGLLFKRSFYLIIPWYVGDEPEPITTASAIPSIYNVEINETSQFGLFEHPAKYASYEGYEMTESRMKQIIWEYYNNHISDSGNPTSVTGYEASWKTSPVDIKRYESDGTWKSSTIDFIIHPSILITPASSDLSYMFADYTIWPRDYNHYKLTQTIPTRYKNYTFYYTYNNANIPATLEEGYPQVYTATDMSTGESISNAICFRYRLELDSSDIDPDPNATAEPKSTATPN